MKGSPIYIFKYMRLIHTSNDKKPRLSFFRDMFYIFHVKRNNICTKCNLKFDLLNETLAININHLKIQVIFVFNTSDWKYCVIQCTGYLKSWAPAKIGLEEQEGETDGEACNLSCLVAVGRLQTAISTTVSSKKPHLRPIQFVSRHAMDGKFLFVDQRSVDLVRWFRHYINIYTHHIARSHLASPVHSPDERIKVFFPRRATPVLGFLPQELLGTSMYEYYHHDDIPHLAESHKAALQTSERVTTQVLN